MDTITKHTPGPWKAVETGKHWNNPNLINWQIHWSEAGECICDTVYEEADAHLMAAAPDLLEALKALMAADRHDLRDTQDHSGLCFPDLEVPVICAACMGRAAIAKAEGRA